MEIPKPIKFIDIGPEMSVMGVATKALLELLTLAFSLTAATYLANGRP